MKVVGLSDAQIQLISGHKTKKSLELYQHVSLQAVESAYQHIPPRLLLFLAPLRCLGTAQSSFICNRYKTDRAYFAAGETSVGFTPFTVSRRSIFGLTIFEFDRGTTSVAPQLRVTADGKKRRKRSNYDKYINQDCHRTRGIPRHR